MKVISFFLLFLNFNIFACELNKQFEYVSLSGPVTFLLSELGLVEELNLKGISIFSPINKSTYKGKIYGGGLFLSEKEINDFEKKIVFYDSSRELEKYLTKSKASKILEIQTRQLDAVVATQEIVKNLSPYLRNCDEKLKDLDLKIKNIKDKLMSFKKSNKTILFYLGKIDKNKKPNLLIVNDGFVKTLRDLNIVSTYPSELSYVNWSPKIIKNLQNVIYIGISEGEKFKQETQALDQFNIMYPGALTPGLSQLYLIEKMLGLGLL